MSELQAIDELIETPPETSAPRDELEAVTDILEGKNPEKEPGNTAPEDGESQDQETENEEENELGSEEGKLDYALEVPMTDGNKLTLGELKDHYQGYQAKLGELQARENEVMGKHSKAEEMMGYIQQHLPPQRLQQIAQEQQQYLEKEQGLLLDTIPEFKDAATFKQARGEISELMNEYGMSELLQTITDHRIVKMLNDFAKLKGSVRKAKETVKPIRSKDPKGESKRYNGSAGETKQLAERAKQTGSHGDQVAAIQKLLG